jgi:hypothetical protein
VLEREVREVDRADIRIQPFGDQRDDVVERLLQVVRARDDVGDVRQQ